MTMTPYSTLPPFAFWRTGVADLNSFEITGLWQPRFKIARSHKVAPFGSCVAQHIGRSMKERGYAWLSTERSPDRVPAELAKKYNYDIFTCRTGNIYTTSLLLQWTRWALGKADAPDECWEKEGRFFDPFRPAVEPGGFASAQEMLASRNHTIEAFRRAITECTYFVFTLGLTESWWDPTHSIEYPTCPGTVAGTFDPKKHVFMNQGFSFIYKNLVDAMDLMRAANPRIRFLLTVSPVPLTATASGRHVLVATMASKSILRAVADLARERRWNVDYFPSYEIVNSPVFKGALFEPNQRSVSKFGVNFVMSSFFRALEGPTAAANDPRGAEPRATARITDERNKDIICEEELLQAFGPQQTSSAA